MSSIIASATCTVNNTPLATSGTTGINVAASSTITIKLANPAGVSSWSIVPTSADDLTASNGNLLAVQQSAVVNYTAFSATFVMPPMILDGYRGSAIQFTSRVNGTVFNSSSVTFGVFVLNLNGTRLFFGGETNESNATVGNAADLNAIINQGLPGGTFLAGGDLSGTSTSQTIARLQGITLSAASPTDSQVLTYSASTNQWSPQTGGGGGGGSSSTWSAFTTDGSWHTVYTLSPAVATDEVVTMSSLTKIRGAANTTGVFTQRDYIQVENEGGTLTDGYVGTSTTIDSFSLGTPPAGAAVQVIPSGTTLIIQAKSTSGSAAYASTNISLDRTTTPSTTSITSISPSYHNSSSSMSFSITGVGLSAATAAGVVIGSTYYPMTITGNTGSVISGTLTVSAIGKGQAYVTVAATNYVGATFWSLNSAAPSITSLTPNSGANNTGTSVAIVGSGFTGCDIAGVGVVSFSDGVNTVVASSVVYNSDTSLTAITGTDGTNTGTGVGTVTTPNGSGTKPWTYTAAGAILSFSAGTTPGAISIPSWLSYARAATGLTAQSSANSYISGIASNTPFVMYDGYQAGLMLEEAWIQEAANNNNITASPWSGSSGVTVTTGQQGPDGSGGLNNAFRVQTTATNAQTNFISYGGTGVIPAMYSMWYKGTSAAQSFVMGYGLVHQYSLSATTTWQRVDINDASETGTENYIIPVFETASGRDVEVCAPSSYYNSAGSLYPASLYISTATTATTVPGSELKVVPSVSSPINSGNLNPHITFVPNGNLSQYGSNMYVLTDTANPTTNYVRFSNTGYMTILWNGVSVSPPTPISFTAGQVIQLNMTIGASATSVSWSVNGGSPVVQSGASVGAITLTSNLDILSNGSANQFGCRLQTLAFY